MLEFLFLNVIKEETPTPVFSCEFFEIFKKIFFTEHLRATVSVFFKVAGLQPSTLIKNKCGTLQNDMKKKLGQNFC